MGCDIMESNIIKNLTKVWLDRSLETYCSDLLFVIIKMPILE